LTSYADDEYPDLDFSTLELEQLPLARDEEEWLAQVARTVPHAFEDLTLKARLAWCRRPAAP